MKPAPPVTRTRCAIGYCSRLGGTATVRPARPRTLAGISPSSSAPPRRTAPSEWYRNRRRGRRRLERRSSPDGRTADRADQDVLIMLDDREVPTLSSRRLCAGWLALRGPPAASRTRIVRDP